MTGRWTILEGDCVEQMQQMEPGSVDSVVCDPPYNLNFMSRAWDRIDGEQVDPAFMHWFAGFVDGEGCFSVHKKNVNGYETYDCQFSITLRADDRPILERIQRTLGMGTLSKPTAHRTGADNPKARYSISRKTDCLRLREIFRGFPLRAKKANDMELWSDALDAWVGHEPGGGWDDVAEARALLMASRAYVDEGIRVDPFQMWCWRWGREAMRVLKPGGHCLAFGGTRTMHRLAAGLEDAGFEIRDTICWLYGSGFPKSLDVSKAIDKAAPRAGMFDAFAAHFRERREASGLSQKGVAVHFPSKTGGLTGCVWNWENGANVPTLEQWATLQPLLGLGAVWLPLIERVEAEREVVGTRPQRATTQPDAFNYSAGEVEQLTVPATPEAEQWAGWGTA